MVDICLLFQGKISEPSFSPLVNSLTNPQKICATISVLYSNKYYQLVSVDLFLVLIGLYNMQCMLLRKIQIQVE